jgi:WD40 repeat protein/tetratricopeptide (TPR) repeat protein
VSHQGAVTAVSFSPDRKIALTGSNDTLARLWIVSADRVGLPLDHQGKVRAAVFSPDGKTVLTGSDDRTARLWETATGRPLGQPMRHQASVNAVAFSGDGKTVVTGSDDETARLWEAPTGRPLGQPLLHDHFVHAVAFSPDGKTVLTGSKDWTARLWEAATGRPLGQTMKHQAAVNVVAFSPDSKTILTGSGDGTTALWDAATGRPLRQFMRHQNNVNSVAFSPDSMTILTGDHEGNAAQLRNVDNGSKGPSLNHHGRVSAVAFGPDGKSVLTGSWDGTARLWDAATGGPLGQPLSHRDYVNAVAFSPDGKTVLTGSWDRTARLWDAATGGPLGPPLMHQNRLDFVAYSPDGKTILTVCGDTTARLWVAPNPPRDLPELKTEVEVAAGLEVDRQGRVHMLDSSAWHERRAQLGGPSPDPAPGLDPILFGPDPTARADALASIGRTAQAEDAYAQAIRARPLNPSVWIGRAHFYAARAELEKAAADYARCFALGDRRPELFAQIMTDDATFARVLEHSSEGNVVALVIERGRYLADRPEWVRAETVFTQALATYPGEARLWTARGDVRGRRGAWREAAADLARGLELDPRIDMTWYRLASLLSHLGDVESYRRHRRRMLERFATTDDGGIAEHTVRACLHLPADLTELDQACQLAERAVATASPAFLLPYAELARGLAEYRRGRLPEAIRWLDQALSRDVNHWSLRLPAKLIQTMAHLRLGEHAAARVAWEQAAAIEQEVIPRPGPVDFTVHWFDRLICAALHREVESMFLDANFPTDPFAR